MGSPFLEAGNQLQQGARLRKQRCVTCISNPSQRRPDGAQISSLRGKSDTEISGRGCRERRRGTGLAALPRLYTAVLRCHRRPEACARGHDLQAAPSEDVQNRSSSDIGHWHFQRCHHSTATAGRECISAAPSATPSRRGPIPGKCG